MLVNILYFYYYYNPASEIKTKPNFQYFRTNIYLSIILYTVCVSVCSMYGFLNVRCMFFV